MIAVIKNNKTLKVRYGNRYVTSLNPQYFEYDYSLSSINMQVDGKNKLINFGEKIKVAKSFRVLAGHDYRVNIIGYSKYGRKNENGLLVNRKQIKSRFSIDKNKNIYRVEIYKGNKFSGMILVDFLAENITQPISMKKSDVENISSSKL